jgi:hypothetical protein
MQTLRDVEDHVGVYYSREWVIKNILMLGEDEAKEMKEQIAQEAAENPDPGPDEET